MSNTFLLVKNRPVSPDDVEAIRRLYTRRVPRWFLRLWLRVHGWRMEPLITFSGRADVTALDNAARTVKEIQ